MLCLIMCVSLQPCLSDMLLPDTCHLCFLPLAQSTANSCATYQHQHMLGEIINHSNFVCEVILMSLKFIHSELVVAERLPSCTLQAAVVSYRPGSKCPEMASSDPGEQAVQSAWTHCLWSVCRAL